MTDYFSSKKIVSQLGVVSSMLIWLLIPLTWNVSLPEEFWVKQGIFLLVLLAAYYTNALVLVPRFLVTNRLALYALLVVASVAIVLVVLQVAELSLHLPELMHKTFNPSKPYKPHGTFRFDMFALLISFVVLGLSTSITLIRKWQTESEQRQEFEKQKISAELSFLKAQINPHFFFNTLNNIYALTTLDVEAARQAIHKLSGMMRYVLYDTQKETCLLSHEIAFVENYIELMKLRLTDKVKVVFEKPATIIDHLVAPMIMLPFIENAFKHGVSAKAESQIVILIRTEENRLLLDVKNHSFQHTGLKLEETSGIGHNNTRRRLELIYPGQYTLDIHDSGTQYHVSLTLVLS
ncbi:MAG: histidine kinase [Cyclobacteriaceae bacterium]|nr:histidine kinase [Cyclobacteriaceae bacterium]